jgi:hypothetical protein
VAQLFQFIWKTRYLLIWMGVLLASMSLHSQSAEVLRLYWFDHRLNLEHAFWQHAFWQQLSWRGSWQHLSWHTFWLVIGFVYSGCVFAAAAAHIATHKEPETLRGPRWIITVALAAPVLIVLVAMIAALIAWREVERVSSAITNGCAILVVALLLLALFILWVERPRKVATFSDRLGAVFGSPTSKRALEIATGIFGVGFLVMPLLPINYFIVLATTIGSLPTLLISLAVLMYVIHRLVALQGSKRGARWALAISIVILLVLLPALIRNSDHTYALVILAAVVLLGLVCEFLAAQPSYKAAIGVSLGLFAALLALGDIAPTTKVRKFDDGPLTSAPVLKAAFADWIGARADLEDYKNAQGMPAPYPVFIVAAQGGGLLAAYHAAMVLSHLQDHCPRFAQHVFAVSGVSGGSLGAAVFASAVDRLATEQSRSPCQPEAVAKRFQEYSEDVLRRDFLSPLVFMAVIPTIAQRVLSSLLPEPLSRWVRIEDNIGFYDRARGLEYGFEAASTASDRQNAGKTGFFQRGMRSTWRPQRAGPALVVSMTRADTGEPYWIAPFRMGEVRADTIVDGVEVIEIDYRQKVLTIENPEIDVRVSTAVGLSARFPFVTPPGTLDVVGHRWLEKQNRFQTVGFVDGGYFENSGVESAWRLALAIKEERDGEEREKGVALRPIAIYILRVGEISGFRYTRFRSQYLSDMKWFPQEYVYQLPEDDLRSPAGSELLAPLRAVDASRQFRAWHGWLGSVANNRLINNTTATKIDTADDLFFGLTAETNPLPLGWQLTSETFSRIRARQHLPLPGQSCIPSLKDKTILMEEMNRLKAYGEDISAFVDRWNYGCAAAAIWKHLSPGATTAAAR